MKEHEGNGDRHEWIVCGGLGTTQGAEEAQVEEEPYDRDEVGKGISHDVQQGVGPAGPEDALVCVNHSIEHHLNASLSNRCRLIVGEDSGDTR